MSITLKQILHVEDLRFKDSNISCQVRYFLTVRKIWEYYWSLISSSDIIRAKLIQNECLLTYFLYMSTDTFILDLLHCFQNKTCSLCKIKVTATLSFLHTGIMQMIPVRKPMVHIHPAKIHQLNFLLVFRLRATIIVYSTATWINQIKILYIRSSWNYVMYKL